MQLTFESANDLALALRRAEAAHGQYEKETGQPDVDWPIWYVRLPRAGAVRAGNEYLNHAGPSPEIGLGPVDVFLFLRPCVAARAM